MRVPRIHIDSSLAAGAQVTLGAQGFTHCVRVLRLQSGAPLILFNGDGYDYAARLESVDKRRATAVIESRSENCSEPPIEIHLGLGLAKADHMDYAIQKAVELGVQQISPVICRRSVARIAAPKQQRKLEHWSGVVISACEQCGRSRIPRLQPPSALDRWLAQLPDGSTRLLLDHRSNKGLRDLPAARSLTLLIGPEGGFSKEERALAFDHGFSGIRLGARILRAETAPIAVLAAIHALWGDLG